MTLERKVIVKLLEKAKKADPHYDYHGAGQHRYTLGSPSSEKNLTTLESKYKLKLPRAFRDFLLKIAKDGAGPGYGLMPLEKTFRTFKKLNVSKPFPLSKKEIASALKHKKEDQNFVIYKDDPLPLDGVLPVAEEGDDLYWALVMNGAYQGSIWMVGEAWSPVLNPKTHKMMNFEEWYSLWLESLAEEGSKDSSSRKTSELPNGDPEALKKLKNALRNASKTKALHLGDSYFEIFPEAIGKLEKLESLSIGNGEFREISPVIKELSFLKELDFSENSNVSELPQELTELKKLEKLFIYNMPLTKLPKGFEKLLSLKDLTLSFTKIESLPPEFVQLKSLKSLDLSLNFKLDLDKLWPVLAKMEALEHLNLSDCNITSFPKTIAKPARLKTLAISENDIPSSELERLRSSLKNVDIEV